MTDQLSDDELHDLIDALSDDSITADEAAELNRRLESDGRARQLYLQHMFVEAELCSLHSSSVVDATASDADDARLQQKSLNSVRSGLHSDRFSGAAWLAIAASLLAVALTSSLVTYQFAQRGNAPLTQNASVDETPLRETIATITATRNCSWQSDNRGLGFGSPLAAGDVLRLKAGAAEITFGDGARVVIEGPAEFRMPSSHRAELLAGRASAAVPRDAAKFSIGTPRLVVHNPGTQFGLVANDDGGAEVHVFEGPLRATVIGDNGHRIDSVDLEASEAARLAPLAPKFALMRASGNSFVRSLVPVAGPDANLLAIEEFAYPVGPLAWQNGGFGWAGPWADIEAAPPTEGSEVLSTNCVGEGSLAGCEVLSVGNRAVQLGNQNRIRRALSTSIGGVFDAAGLIENVDGLRLIGQSGKTTYVSVLQRVSKLDEVFYGFELHRGDGNFNRVLCVGSGVEETGYGVTSNYNDYLGDRWQSLGDENTATNLIVIRIDFGADDSDLVTVYRNPVSLVDERKCVASATLRGNFAFDRLSLANFNGAKVHEIDEIRVGTTFEAVTGRHNYDAAMARLAAAQPVFRPHLQLGRQGLLSVFFLR
jgi:hypothetical protein